MSDALALIASQLGGSIAVLLLFSMKAVPFAVWAGRSVCASIAANGGYPGHGRTSWFVILPAALLIYGRVRGYALETQVGDYRGDENGQLLFLAIPPCLGLIAGYVLGRVTARRRQLR